MRVNCRKWIGLVLGVLLVAAFVISALPQQSYAMGFGPKLVKVPNVVDKRISDAVSILTNAKLKMVPDRGVYVETTDRGKTGLVAGQNPKAGAMVIQNFVVTVKTYRYVLPPKPPAPSPPPNKPPSGPPVGAVPRVPVPNVVGKTLGDAISSLRTAGLSLLDKGTVHTDDQGLNGKVAEQNPRARELVARGSKVAVKTYTNVPQVEVPNVVGRTEAEAKNALSQAGLTMVVNRNRKTFDQNQDKQVYAQTPAGNAIISQGSAVTVVLYQYEPPPVAVPNVIGNTQAEAQKTLSTAGFGMSVGADSQTIDQAKDGKVAVQNPRASARAVPGSEVTVKLYKYVAPVAVPNVIGKTRADAVRTLQTAGFKTVQKVIVTHDKTESGIVAEQNPKANAMAAPGSEVTVKYYRYVPPKVTVPNVVGQSENDARNSLLQAGFAMKVTQRVVTSEESKDGNVSRQNPTPNSQASQGSTVNVDVYQWRSPQDIVTVPNVVGKTESNARTTLFNAGLHMKVAGPVETHTPSQHDKVARQNPPPNTRIYKSDSVVVNLYRFVGEKAAPGGHEGPEGGMRPGG